MSMLSQRLVRPIFVRMVAGALLAWSSMAPAAAQDLCGPLTRLLAAPPAGFLASRVHADGDQRWTAAPVVPHAVCGVWESRGEDADTLRCTINDRMEPAAVKQFYTSGAATIDRCLASLPATLPWARQTAAVAVEGLSGTETTWVHDTDALRFKISLSDYLRTATQSSYNSFVVEYLKY